MASRIDHMGQVVGHDVRCLEVTHAISLLPEDCKLAVLAMYGVEKMERPRTERQAAEVLGWPKSKLQALLNRGYGWLGRDLCLPIQ
jgi:hypothetical protein